MLTSCAEGNGQPVSSQQRRDLKPQGAVSGSPFSSVNVHTWHAGQGLPQDLPAGAQKQNASQPLVTLQKCLILLLCLYTKFKANRCCGLF